jgi:phosphatidylserine/phosphatidylglycerophosphate/cardiolipin synthase-like enzyme
MPEITLLRDVEHGGAATQPAAVAQLLAKFVAVATVSLDVSIYDFRLDEPLAGPVVKAFKDAAGRGVKVRIGFDAGKPAAQTTAAFHALGADPAPVGTKAWLEEQFGDTQGIELKAIKAAPHLMHNKYLVRDVNTEKAAVWMGSANFTNSAWTRQENNILRFASPTLATAYETDFEELWRTGSIKSTGVNDTGEATIDGIATTWAFSPGEGAAIDAHLAAHIAAAKKRIRIASMVLTSHTVLGALADAIDGGMDVQGVYDGGQMKGIEKEWAKSPKSAAILETWKKVKASLTEKPSAPYSPDGPHDFMHNKVLVSDDLVVTGSFNLSKNAEGNAENQVTLADAGIAKQYATYINALVKQYKK